jgi:hypothetical protein
MNWTWGLWRIESVQQMTEFVKLWDLVCNTLKFLKKKKNRKI